MADSCPLCIGDCDCISSEQMDVPEVNAAWNDRAYDKIVLNIEYKGENRVFNIREMSWWRFFRKHRKFVIQFGEIEWDVDYNRKNKIQGYDKYRPANKMIILKNVHFPPPHSAYKIDFGWWLPRFEGGPKPQGRFGFLDLFHNDVPLFTTQIGIYIEDDFSHLTPVWEEDSSSR